MKYNKFIYVYPPRPKLYSSTDLDFFGKNYVAQLKLNDTRNVIFIHPDGKIEFRTRHKEPHKAYTRPHPKLIEALQGLGLPKGAFHVLDSLLLHSKTKHVKDTVCLMDILVYNGEYLLGSTFEEREKLLKQVCGNPRRLEQHSGLELALEIKPLLWLAKSYDMGFQSIWEHWQKVFESGEQIVEGLVFKLRAGKLGYHFNDDKCSWMGKIRYAKEGIYRM